jgi:hypothetical protein
MLPGSIFKSGSTLSLLCAKVWASWTAGNYEKARVDLEEAREIAERGEMKLFLADYYLESARLARSEKNKERMAEHYGQAKALIQKCGYHRRDGELEELACVSHKPPRAQRPPSR